MLRCLNFAMETSSYEAKADGGFVELIWADGGEKVWPQASSRPSAGRTQAHLCGNQLDTEDRRTVALDS